MSVIATIALPADAVVLGNLLDENPERRIRLERIRPVDAAVVSYFWATDEGIDAIEATLHAGDAVTSFTRLDSIAGETLLRVELLSRRDGVFDALVASDGTLQQAVGSAETWVFELRFPAHDDLTAFYRACVARDIRLDVRAVHNPDISEALRVSLTVTEPQREALLSALELGYYDVPRGGNLSDVAAAMGLSETATKQRLTRGTANFLEATLARDSEMTDIDSGRQQ